MIRRGGIDISALERSVFLRGCEVSIPIMVYQSRSVIVCV